MKCRDILHSINFQTEVVEKRPKQVKTGFGSLWIQKPLCLFHLFWLISWHTPPPSPSPALWSHSMDLAMPDIRRVPLAQAASCIQCITSRAVVGFPYHKSQPQLVAHSPGLHRQPGHLLGALQCSPGVTNPLLMLAGTVITGHQRFDDKQLGDKQTARNTAARRPSKSVWIPHRKRRFQNQGNQGGKSWDVCWGHWLAQHPTAMCPGSITHCTLLITPTWACVDGKTWKSLGLREAGGLAQLHLYFSWH